MSKLDALLKFSDFSGEEADWDDFYEQFVNKTSLSKPDVAKLISETKADEDSSKAGPKSGSKAVSSKADEDFAKITEADGFLDALLRSLCKGKAGRKLRTVVRGPGSGVKCWSALLGMYQPQGFSTAMRLFKQLIQLRMDPADSGAYFDRIQLLASKLETMRMGLPKHLLVMFSLAALPEEFEHLRKTLLLKKTDIDYEVDLVAPAEELSKAHRNEPSHSAHAAQTSAHKQKQCCRWCQRIDHVSRDCPTKPTCQECGVRGHTIDSCFNKHPELRPANFKPREQPQPRQHQEAARTVSEPHPTFWVL